MNMCTLLPTKCIGASFTSLGESLKIYSSFLANGSEACKSEFERWQRKWAKVSPDHRPGTLVDALRSCNKISYPNIAILLQIFATIPVITTTAERSFSSLRVLKTYLRSTMKEGRKEGRTIERSRAAGYPYRHSLKYGMSSHSTH